METLFTYAYANWAEWFFAAILAFLGWSYRKMAKKMEDEKEKNDALRNGVQALLRDRIIQAYNYYHEKGYCPIYGKENVKRMYDSYHDLDGNDVATELVKKLLEMPEEREE